MHTVLVRWRDGDESRAAQVESLVDHHLARIPGVERVDRGPAVRVDGIPVALQWMLVVHLAEGAQFDDYAAHLDHRPVAEALQANAEHVAVVDVSTA